MGLIWTILCLAGAIAAQADRPSRSHDIVGLASGAKGSVLTWLRVETRSCERRAGPTAIGAVTCGAARSGALWTVETNRLVLRDATTGVRLGDRGLPDGWLPRALCSDPSRDHVFAIDDQHRLWEWASGRPTPVRGWRREWIGKARRVVGLAVDPLRQWLFIAAAATAATGGSQVLCFDFSRGRLAHTLSPPTCGCYELRPLTGIAWDTRSRALYLTDGPTTVSARVATDEAGARKLLLRHYCVFEGTRRGTGLAAVTPRIRAALHGPADVGTQTTSVMVHGIRAERGFSSVESGDIQRSIACAFGDGEKQLLAIPRCSSLVGTHATIRWRTPDAISEPLALKFRISTASGSR